MVRSRTKTCAVYEVTRRETMWCPRKPQPPTTRTLPREVLVLGGIGAIVGNACGLEMQKSKRLKLMALTPYPCRRGALVLGAAYRGHFDYQRTESMIELRCVVRCIGI